MATRATGQTCEIGLRERIYPADDDRSGGPLLTRERGVDQVDPIQSGDAVFREDREMRFLGVMRRGPRDVQRRGQVGQEIGFPSRDSPIGFLLRQRQMGLGDHHAHAIMRQQDAPLG